MKKSLLAIVLLIFSVAVIAQEADGCLKVITYNIWNGYDWGKDEGRRTEVAEWIARQEPTIVALQELCKYTPEKLEEDALSWGHPYSVLLKTTGYSVGLKSIPDYVQGEDPGWDAPRGPAFCNQRDRCVCDPFSSRQYYLPAG